MFSERDLDNMIEAFGAVDVIILLDADQVGALRGHYRMNTDFTSPYDYEERVNLPSVRVKTSAIGDLTMDHRLQVGGVTYRQHHKPDHGNGGFSLIALVKE
ncbi:hypothetical protein [Desulfuromonas acetoxidans]|uniref:hypothetical protein n=1 Tax=Desulfuromonas acetoxidans TaxID=891 RepID=UPI002931591F|nr:hypothetical protein [Desulfuromonas acetoxidans]